MNIELFTNVVNIVFAIIGCLVTYFLIPYLRQKGIEFWVKSAVEAAEQTIKGIGTGEQRKEFVLKFLNNSKLFKKLGFKITEEQLDILIEAAVINLNIKQGK